MRIAALILAAGASQRFGTPKQLARVGDRTMLSLVTETAKLAGLDPIIAVVPPAIPVPPDVVPVINAQPEAGMSRSLGMGIAAVPAGVDAVVILLGDQPTLKASVIRAMVLAAPTARTVVAARANGLVGPPVLLKREAFALALDAVGDEGLRSLLRTDSELVTVIEVEEHAPDVDTPADLERLS